MKSRLGKCKKMRHLDFFKFKFKFTKLIFPQNIQKCFQNRVLKVFEKLDHYFLLDMIQNDNSNSAVVSCGSHMA